MPCPVGPHFYPRVVVICVCPPGGIDLTGRNSYGSHGGYPESGFFSASSEGSSDGGERRGGAGVAGTVGSFFMTPVVDFQGCLSHGHPLEAGSQFAVENLTCGIEIFIVDPDGEDEMKPFAAGYGFSPGEFLAGPEGARHVLFPVLARIIGQVGGVHRRT